MRENKISGDCRNDRRKTKLRQIYSKKNDESNDNVSLRCKENDGNARTVKDKRCVEEHDGQMELCSGFIKSANKMTEMLGQLGMSCR